VLGGVVYFSNQEAVPVTKRSHLILFPSSLERPLGASAIRQVVRAPTYAAVQELLAASTATSPVLITAGALTLDMSLLSSRGCIETA
jgi:hypothetical protein